MKRNKGFTLFEILFVTLIIGALFAFSMTAISDKQTSSRIRFQTIEIDGCEYIETLAPTGNASVVPLVHKANCPNPVHKNDRNY